MENSEIDGALSEWAFNRQDTVDYLTIPKDEVTRNRSSPKPIGFTHLGTWLRGSISTLMNSTSRAAPVISLIKAEKGVKDQRSEG